MELSFWGIVSFGVMLGGALSVFGWWWARDLHGRIRTLEIENSALRANPPTARSIAVERLALKRANGDVARNAESYASLLQCRSEIKQLKTVNKWRATRMKTLAAELKALKEDFGV